MLETSDKLKDFLLFAFIAALFLGPILFGGGFNN